MWDQPLFLKRFLIFYLIDFFNISSVYQGKEKKNKQQPTKNKPKNKHKNLLQQK